MPEPIDKPDTTNTDPAYWEQVLESHGLPEQLPYEPHVVNVGSSIDLERYVSRHAAELEPVPVMPDTDKELARRAINQIKPTLTPKELAVFKLRFEADPPMTHAEIGKAINLVRSRVTQIEQSILRRLRRAVSNLVA
jgi:RNA polymerase sigma factor (sigma-70 family)